MKQSRSIPDEASSWRGSGHQRTACAPSDGSPAATAIERMAYTVEEAASMLEIGRDLIYDEIRNGHLHSKKVGARRIIGRHHILEWLDADECERKRGSVRGPRGDPRAALGQGSFRPKRAGVERYGSASSLGLQRPS
jgi:excisionase family DNA binding protein